MPRPWPAPEVTEVEPGFNFSGDGWRLSSCSVPHAQPALDCMAFRLEAGGRSLVYSGDAGLCADLEALAQGTDLLLHWCYRLDGETVSPIMKALTPSPPEIAALATRVGAGRLLLTHFRVHMDTPERHAAAREELTRGFGGASEITEDLNVYEI